MNFENNKPSKAHRLLFKLPDKINCHSLKNIKKLKKNNKSKIPAPMWNDKFEWPNGVCSVPDTPYYFECIIKKR